MIRILVALLIFSQLAAAAPSAEQKDTFLSGIKAYNEGQFEEAKTIFEGWLETHGHSDDVVYNLGLAEYKLGQQGRAIGLWRDILSGGLVHSQANAALQFALDNLAVKEIPHQALFREQLRATVLAPVPGPFWYLAALFSFFLVLYQIFSYIGFRRRAILAEVTPPAPWISIYLLAVFAIVFATTATLKLMTELEVRATVVAKEVNVYSAPDEEAVELFKLYEGLEVVLKGERQDWLQVRYPGGLSGWIKAENLYVNGKRTL